MFDYYYGNEAEQFSFLRVPMFLITDKTFSDLSSDAKLLYSLMLNRIGLSVRNGWLDEKNRVYIIFTLEEAKECLKCANDKCSRTFKELEDIGLICRKKRGMGKPAITYVKNFVSDIEEDVSEENFDEECSEPVDKPSEIKTSENQKSRLPKNRSQDSAKSEVLTTENRKSRLPKNRTLDSAKSEAIKTDIIKTDFKKTENIETDVEKIYQSYPSIAPEEKFFAQENFFGDEMEKIERKPTKEIFSERKNCLERVKANISFDILKEKYSDCGGLAEEIAEMITDVIMGLRKVYVSGKIIPQRLAAEKFLQLEYQHAEYVINSISELDHKICKPDAYICTALYNALFTLGISTFAGFTASTGIRL